jgi:hypothetical protein
VGRLITGEFRIVALVEVADLPGHFLRKLRQNEDPIQLQAFLAVMAASLRIGMT